MQNIRTNALNNAWPEAGTWEALTINARKEHIGSGPCGTGVGHCHGGPAALIACSGPGELTERSFISCGPCGAKPPSWYFFHVSWHPFPQICLGKDCFIKKHPRCLLLAPCSSLFALCLYLLVFNATFLKGWAPEYNYPHLRSSAPEAASICKHKWNVSSEHFSLDFKASLLHFLICYILSNTGRLPTLRVPVLFWNRTVGFHDLNCECNAMQIIPSWK